jgi:hypothetical protein
VELDVLQDAVVPLDAQRVLADEQMLVAGKSGHRVAGADPFKARIRPHAHDGGVELGARLKIPARPERRIERQAVMGDLDGGDFHAKAGDSGMKHVITALGARVALPRARA